LQSCREGIATLSPLAQTQKDNIEVQRLIATAEGSYANALRLSGKPQDAVVQARLAVESLQALQSLAPSNAEYRRLASSAETILAGSLAASGDIPGSLDAFGRSIRSVSYTHLDVYKRQRLEHPHIASIFDAGETPDGDPYFVMEHVDGVPITKYAETHGLTVSQRLDLFLQACDAVQYAHRNLTVHRDLKPSNILVTEAGAVKLLDFGVAKLIETEAGTADAPPTEALLTPAYTSPEQIRREPASTSGDVFQLGILLYELLAGEHPFQRKGRLPHEVMRAICDDEPPPPVSYTHLCTRATSAD